MKYWLVVPAAGLGSRFNSALVPEHLSGQSLPNPHLPKQYGPLAGRTVIEHSLERLLSLPCEALIVAIHSQDRIWQTLDISADARIRVVTGGSERADSVSSALKAIAAEADDQDWVLVHDVVRPCITTVDLQRLIFGVADSSVGGLLATPVTATLKRVAATEVASDGAVTVGVVDESLDREGLWLASTPQMFRYGLLVEAMKAGLEQGFTITDEAAAMELAGYQPIIIHGRADNIKITYSEDLALAEAILQAQDAALQSDNVSLIKPGGASQ